MRDAQAFEEALAEGAQAVEAHLDLLLPAADAYPAVIHEAMRYGALGGGKRLRGILVGRPRALVEPLRHFPMRPPRRARSS